MRTNVLLSVVLFSACASPTPPAFQPDPEAIGGWTQSELEGRFIDALHQLTDRHPALQLMTTLQVTSEANAARLMRHIEDWQETGVSLSPPQAHRQILAGITTAAALHTEGWQLELTSPAGQPGRADVRAWIHRLWALPRDSTWTIREFGVLVPRQP